MNIIVVVYEGMSVNNKRLWFSFELMSRYIFVNEARNKERNGIQILDKSCHAHQTISTV